jgi:thermostable 8-oxoguanine DNA glycosylase
MEQVDFLSHVAEREPRQLTMFDHRNRAHTQKHTEIDVSKFFSSITPEEIREHKSVWAKLHCKHLVDEFQRWLFAFMSVHTSYESNMKGYLAIKDWTDWFNKDPDILTGKLIDSGVGLYNNRTKFVTAFARKFWSNPSFFKIKKNESWAECRDRLVGEIHGLGKAKVSFALEMIFPFEAQVACMDTHLFQAYGYDQSLHLPKYNEIESHWVLMSRIWNVNPAISRGIFWDRKKNQPNSYYWMKVFDPIWLDNL